MADIINNNDEFKNVVKLTENYSDIRRKDDGTYIVKFKGHDFHITEDYPQAELYGIIYTYEKLHEYAEEHPEEVTGYVEPEPPEPDEEALKRARIAKLEAEAQGLLPYIQAGIDVDIYQQKLTDVMLEIEELKGNI